MWGSSKDRRGTLADAALPESQEYEPHQVLKGHQDFVRSVEALNATCVASSADDKTIKLWNSTNGQLLGTLEGHATWVACLCPLLPRTDLDPEDSAAKDQFLASGSFDTSIKVGAFVRGSCSCLCVWCAHACACVYMCATSTSGLFD